jgi:hypothetical protein
MHELGRRSRGDHRGLGRLADPGRTHLQYLGDRACDPGATAVNRQRERGSVTLETMFAVGFLLIPAAALLTQLPGWVGTIHAAQAAATEAARHVVLADSMAAGVAEAHQAATSVIVNHGLDASEMVDIEVSAAPAGELQRGQVVTVTVTVRGSPIVVPGLGSVGNPFNAVGGATERVDDYRSLGP